uniref:Leucine-rich repeat domain-containing protein n=1 Tax=Strongyloides papillosus TaxID=174720 RepID=A0A0N5BIH9_STREA
MSDKDLLNKQLSEIFKSNVDKINPELKSQNAHDDKKEIKKTRTERTSLSEVKKAVKKLFSFETLVKAMHCGEVPALLAEHSLQGVPHREISVERMSAEFLWLNSMPAGREMLKHFPALKGVAYSDCNFLKKVIISSRIRILICFNKKCKCNFRNVFGKRKRPYIITCPNTCQGGPAMLAYAELTDIWRLGQWTQIFN